MPNNDVEQKTNNLLALSSSERDVQLILSIKGDPTKREQGDTLKKEIVGEHGSKSAFNILMKNPSKGGKSGGSSNPSKAKGWAVETQTA